MSEQGKPVEPGKPMEPTKKIETTTTTTPGTPAPEQRPHDWQAIFSPQHGAYYFFNSTTGETTWVNPLQGPEAASSSSRPEPEREPNPESNPEPGAAPTSHYAALQAAALAQGIDPALAHLDPSLLPSTNPSSSSSSTIPVFTAKFNRHTGAFARPDARDPSHLSEHERAKRMSEFYFDVNQWEQDLAKHGGSIRGSSSGGPGSGRDNNDEWEDDGQGGRKRKRPSKKDLDRFKAQKKLKKLAKTAWLRS